MKTKILKFISKLAKTLGIRSDLILHLLVSFVICFGISVFSLGSFGLSVGITMIIGVGKEIYDVFKKNPTGFDIYDLFFDGFGSILGFIVSKIILSIFGL